MKNIENMKVNQQNNLLQQKNYGLLCADIYIVLHSFSQKRIDCFDHELPIYIFYAMLS
jgi:hypothetical protein